MTVGAVVTAIRAGDVAVIPTDTVYGLVCAPDIPRAVRVLAELKRRPPEQPIALLVASVGHLLELVPELRGEAEAIVRAVLPGPFTLVLSNPAARYPLLTGSRPDALGVRVPDLTGPGAAVLEEVGAVAATSANLHDGPDPGRAEEVPAQLRQAAVVLDGGELPGTPSTVVELTDVEPRVVREGAVPTAETLRRIRAALSE